MTPRYFRPRNWERFQGYRKRGPTWIKLHADLLHNYEFAQLTPSAQSILVQLWCLYARVGKPLVWDCSWLGSSLVADCNAIGKALPKLLSNNFIELCAESVAPHARATETETETEGEREEIDKESISTDPGNLANGTDYAFEGTVVRLTEPDLRKWQTNFPNVDVRAELTRLDAYYSETGDKRGWFMRCASVLAKKNTEAGNGKVRSLDNEFI